MSLISANRLFVLTQSPRLWKITQGRVRVQVLTSLTTAPYRCDLSLETVQNALDAALAGTEYLGADWAEKRESFIEQFIRKEQNVSGVDCRNPTVHPELAMTIAIAKLPYIGVSKLSCIMCRHKDRPKDSNEKAYPGWCWPSLPNLDEELCSVFLKRIRQQLGA